MELVTAAEAVVTAELPISANAQRKEDDLRQRKGSADGSTLLWHVPENTSINGCRVTY